jgi:hypothetical protein
VDKCSKNDIIVSPSILSANFSKLGDEVRELPRATDGQLPPRSCPRRRRSHPLPARQTQSLAPARASLSRARPKLA